MAQGDRGGGADPSGSASAPVPVGEVASWWVHPDVGVRVAGLPVRSLEGLRAERTWRRIGRLRERRAAWRRETQRLVDVLEEHIGGIEAGERRGLLVALRRAVFGGRPLRGRIAPARLGAALPWGLAADLLAWQAERERLAGEVERLPTLLAAEIGGCAQALRDWMAEDAARHGLWHASPALAGELEKWLVSAPGVMPERKVVLRLARYLSRVAAKTSPFTAFTAWGLGCWADAAVTPSWAPVSIVQADDGFTQTCAWALAGRDDPGSRLPLRLNTSAVVTPEAVVFLGAAAGEPVHELRLTPMVDACLTAARSHPGVSADELCELLAAASGKGPPRGELHRFVTALVGLGLLEQRLPFADQDIAPWSAIRSWPQAPAQLREVAGDLDDTLRRGATCQEARRAAERVRRLLELDEDAPARPRRELVRHDSILTGPPPACDEESWRPVWGDLNALRPWAALAEASLPLRLAVSAWTVQALGGSGSLPYLSFYRLLCAAGVLESAEDSGSDPAEGSGSDSAEGSGNDSASPAIGGAMGDLRVLTLLRSNARNLLYGRSAVTSPVQGGPVGGTGSRVEQWEAMTRTWPSWIAAPASLSCFVQRTPTGAVLNGIATGYGRGRSRAQALADAATSGESVNGHGDGGGEGDGDGGRYRRESRYRGEVLVAEVDGLFGSGLNRRRPAAAFAIDYPYTRSRRPAEQLIPLADLVVTWEAGGPPVLYSRRHDRQVRPVHLGGVGDGFLPPALRTLVRLFGDFTAPYRPTWLLGEDDDPWAHQGVRHTPRAQLGSLTLARAAWWMRARDLPSRGTGESDAHLMLRWAELFAAHAIPERCFIRILSEQSRRPKQSRAGKERKPLYLDLASPLLLGTVERELSRPDARVVIHEALPDPAHGSPKSGDRAFRTTELVVEVNGPELTYG
ncbi:lantibiotic dehydratase [Actinomadura gamaensis]|uniref:Lantibiotic dehydratase n=1 Tax=Actinomadura gamaensis TaxID=1763541 RepID=A0ABV9UBB2_9ACTN